ncbi:MAG: hypothetical protein MUE72_00610 [Chitinophagaceae bacterium]|nr:hypothetical protein [Chitinophagaceae bacterium]
MAINLLEMVQLNLGFPPLLKIDTTTDMVFINDTTAKEDTFSQAAIPAVLAAMYQYAESDKGAADILNSAEKKDWVKQIFDENSVAVLGTIANYADLSKEDVMKQMNTIAHEAVKITKANLTIDAGIKEVKNFYKSQINTILLYLLPTLHMGTFLQNNTLDDDSNKMEGPISSLMNSIGNAFSASTTQDEVNKKL